MPYIIIESTRNKQGGINMADPVNRSVDVYFLKDGKFVIHNVYSTYTEDELEYMSDEEKAAVVYEFSPVLFPEMIFTLEEIFEDIDF